MSSTYFDVVDFANDSFRLTVRYFYYPMREPPHSPTGDYQSQAEGQEQKPNNFAVRGITDGCPGPAE
jgi:hypothetical protein